MVYSKVRRAASMQLPQPLQGMVPFFSLHHVVRVRWVWVVLVLLQVGRDKDRGKIKNTLLLYLYTHMVLLLFLRKGNEFGSDPKMCYNSCPPLYNAYIA